VELRDAISVEPGARWGCQRRRMPASAVDQREPRRPTVSPQLGKLRVSRACSGTDLRRSGVDVWWVVGANSPVFPMVPRTIWNGS
jgi:hypothetical protein